MQKKVFDKILHPFIIKGKNPPESGHRGNMYVCMLICFSCVRLGPCGLSLPVSSVHGILQAGILEWVATPSSTGSSQLKNGTQVS